MGSGPLVEQRADLGAVIDVMVARRLCRGDVVPASGTGFERHHGGNQCQETGATGSCLSQLSATDPRNNVTAGIQQKGAR
jgi:hypothetical protein